MALNNFSQLIVNKIHDSYIEDLSPLKELEEVIRLHAGKFKHTLGTSVDTRQHRPAVASLTWHGAGIVIGSSQILNPQDFTLEHKHHITTDGKEVVWLLYFSLLRHLQMPKRFLIYFEEEIFN